MHKHLALATALLAATAVGCGGHLPPVKNVEHMPVLAPYGVTVTAPLVRDAILRALAPRYGYRRAQWRVVQEVQGGFEAELTARREVARVLIQYDAQAYAIHHRSSSPSLRYDGQGIHRRYNQWIDSLDRAIQREFARIGTQPAAAPAPPAAVEPVAPAAANDAKAEPAVAAPPVANAPAPK